MKNKDNNNNKYGNVTPSMRVLTVVFPRNHRDTDSRILDIESQKGRIEGIANGVVHNLVSTSVLENFDPEGSLTVILKTEDSSYNLGGFYTGLIDGGFVIR